jgi:hypothetical protein
MPARHRRYGGGYGRRRTRRRRTLALVLLVGLGVAAAWYLRRDTTVLPTQVGTAPSCTPSATATPRHASPTTPPVVLPPPSAVTLSVLNGTNRNLLAKRVADALAAQGFRVTGQGNSRTAVSGPSQVVYGPGASLLARTASSWVLGSVVVPSPRAQRGSVQVVLGSSFTRLATPAEAAAARRGGVPTTAASPSTTPAVLPCRS